MRLHSQGGLLYRPSHSGHGQRGYNFRQSKIENLGVSALGDEDVGGLDVAVNNSLGMRGIEGIGNLDGERENQLYFHRSACDAVLQGRALKKLHNDERSAVLFADVVNCADVGMVQS